MKRLFAFTCLATVLIAAPARALVPGKGPFIGCSVPAGYRDVTSRADVAPNLELDGWAMPGEAWNPGDVIEPRVPGRGIFFIWNKGNYWIVGRGTGGLALQVQINGYSFGAENLVFGTAKPQGSLCDQAQRLAE